jgi:phosphonate transport system substrate-binding protein
MKFVPSFRNTIIGLLAMALGAAAPSLASAEDDKSLVFVVHPFDTPTQLYRRFRPLCDYLQETLGRPLTLRVASRYEEQIGYIADGRADLTYIGPTPYVQARKLAPVRLLAAEAENGKAFYRSVIVVRTDSPVRSLAGLKGRSMAFGAEESFSSSYIPRLLLQDAGVGLEDLGRHAHLGRHERVALAVLHRDFDAGGLREEIAQTYLDRGLRIVATSEPLPPHAIAASPQLPATLAEAARSALLQPTERGRQAFRALGDRISFVPVSDRDYNLARDVVRRLR